LYYDRKLFPFVIHFSPLGTFHLIFLFMILVVEMNNVAVVRFHVEPLGFLEPVLICGIDIL